ncbi:DDHD domain-containing protein [Globomyces pollinis-pini]|nr:DDHD domain-containing protein [Globomyces pollinis-pini]
MGGQYDGIGQYGKNLADLRRTCQETLIEEFDDDESNVMWIPIEWHSKLHGLTTVGERIKSITLPTCSIMRRVNNDILSDVLYYFTSFHGQQLLGPVILYLILANQNNASKDFDHPLESSTTQSSKNLETPEYPQKNTHFPIVYPKLDFIPDLFFAIGSPFPAVLVMRGQSYHDYKIPKPTQYFNIFNLYDPLAYRMEPLIDPRFVEISPVLLQRPSAESKNSFQFSYYQEMIYAYLPDLKLPSMEFPTLSNFTGFPEFPSVFPSLTTMGIRIPSLPQVAILSEAQEVFRKKMMFMLPNIWNSSSSLGDEDDELEEVPDSKKRKRSDKNSSHKRREFENEQGDIVWAEPESEEQSSSFSQRIIKEPVSQIHKQAVKEGRELPENEQPKSPTLTAIIGASSEAKERIFASLSSFLQGSWLSKPENPQPMPQFSTNIKSDVNDLGEQLRKELVEAAAETEAKIAQETEDHSEPQQRVDFFVQQQLLDNMVHQYMVGLRAHFSYWCDKDIMYYILKQLKA